VTDAEGKPIFAQGFQESHLYNASLTASFRMSLHNSYMYSKFNATSEDFEGSSTDRWNN
jgi:hypothetical protein